jgi:hypothetical protein
MTNGKSEFSILKASFWLDLSSTVIWALYYRGGNTELQSGFRDGVGS